MMVFFIAPDAAGPVNLFGQYESHELMGKCKGGKRPDKF